MKISDAFENYLSAFVIPYQSKGTVSVFVNAKKSITTHGDIEITDLNAKFVLDWQTSLSRKGISNNTIRGYTEKLRKVLKYCEANGIKCLNYSLVNSPPKQETIPEWLTAKEVKKLINEALKKRHGRSKVNRFRMAAIISTLYSSGLRVHELCKLNRKDIERKSITIIGKNGKPRIVFFDRRSIFHINNYLKLRNDSNPALFTSQNGKRLTTDKVRECFRNLSKYFHKEVHPHTLRHSYATNLLTNGCHLYTLKQLMGHSSIQSTQQYLHLVDKDLEEAFSKFHSL